MDSKTPIEWLQELSTCHCTRWYEHDREQAESLIAEIILFTAERDRYKAERIIVLSNMRRLMSKAWNKRTRNTWMIQELFGCGSGASYKLCRELGIDPDGNTIDDIAALNKIKEG
jgi:hypothetical protein